MNPINRFLQEFEDIIITFPDIFRIFYHKLNEYKTYLSKAPEPFLKSLRESIPGETTTPSPQPGKEFDFELFLIGKVTWIPTFPGKGINAFHYLTDDIIDYIVSIEADLDVPQMRKNVCFEDRTVDLTFTKHAEDFYTGTIFIKSVTSVSTPDGSRIKKMGGLDKKSIGNKREVIKLLFNYLCENEDFYQIFISEFFIRWKPLLDNGFIKVNAK